MAEKVEIEVWIAMNEDGDYVVGADEAEASELFDQNNGGFARRIVKLTSKMTPPAVEEIEVEIPDTAGTTEQIEVEAA